MAYMRSATQDEISFKASSVIFWQHFVSPHEWMGATAALIFAKTSLNPSMTIDKNMKNRNRKLLSLFYHRSTIFYVIISHACDVCHAGIRARIIFIIQQHFIVAIKEPFTRSNCLFGQLLTELVNLISSVLWKCQHHEIITIKVFLTSRHCPW